MKSPFHFRQFLAAIMAVLALAIAPLSSPAFAETTVTNTWQGAGTVSSDGSGTNTSSYSFGTSANSFAGTLTYTNTENNPYSYGVSNSSLAVNATVDNGGQILGTFNRTGSYTPLYGNAGQQISFGAFSSDGSAEAVVSTSVNYAGLQDLGYGTPRTSGNNSFQASGTTIGLDYNVFTGVGTNSGGITVSGTGSASLTQNYSSASANGFTLGEGGGIYTLANFSGTGIGTVTTGGVATGSLAIANSGSTVYGTDLNPASVVTTIHYDTTNAAGPQSWNYALSGNAATPTP